MALRVYRDSAGGEWRVWRVSPDAASSSTLDSRFRDGWLCFERADGSDRRRLAMSQVPPGWESVSDDRLDSLCGIAEPATRQPDAPPSHTEVAEGSVTKRPKRTKNRD